MTVFVCANTRKQVGDPKHLKVFGITVTVHLILLG